MTDRPGPVPPDPPAPEAGPAGSVPSRPARSVPAPCGDVRPGDGTRDGNRSAGCDVTSGVPSGVPSAAARRRHRPPAARWARPPVAPPAVLAMAVAALGYVGAVDPHRPGHYPVCPLLRFTGLLCPGCGGLRSVHDLVHGDLPGALQANAPVVLGCVLFLIVWPLWFARTVRPRSRPRPRLPHPPGVRRSLTRIAPRPVPTFAVVGLLLAVFTVVRNLPFGAALAP